MTHQASSRRNQPYTEALVPSQGFVQFRMSGATHLDVEALNQRLKSNGALRMRHAMRPDEQYGEPYLASTSRAAEHAGVERC